MFHFFCRLSLTVFSLVAFGAMAQATPCFEIPKEQASLALVSEGLPTKICLNNISGKWGMADIAFTATYPDGHSANRRVAITYSNDPENKGEFPVREYALMFFNTPNSMPMPLLNLDMKQVFDLSSASISLKILRPKAAPSSDRYEYQIVTYDKL